MQATPLRHNRIATAIGLGIASLLPAVILVVVGIFLTLTVIGAILGIPLIIAGVALPFVLFGMGLYAGVRGDCPYCDSKVYTLSILKAAKCGHCKRRLAIDSKHNTLERIV